MTSIRSKLTVRLAILMASLSLAGGGALFISLRLMLIAEFDRSLMLRAHALQSLITQNSSGKLDLDLRSAVFPEFNRSAASEYFSLDDDQGHRLTASSESVLSAKTGNGERWDTVLPSGHPARALRVTFQPLVDDEEGDSHSSANPPEHHHVLTLTLARDTEGLRKTVLGLGVLIGATFAALSGTAIVASTWLVRNGLKTLLKVASNAAQLDLKKSNVRFEVSPLPLELRPVMEKFNEALAVLNDALAREKRFTAAVSHELRTPIAELRAAADIALREPANLSLAVRSARHAQASAERLQTIVSTLLSIVSLERAAEPVRLERLELKDLIDRALHVCGNDLRDSGIVVDTQITPMRISANASLLDAVFDNLLRNVAQYGLTGSTLCIEACITTAGAWIRFINAQVHLNADDVVRLFDPFWRKDSTRSSGPHVGLGLALARTYCEAMGGSISADLTSDGRLRVAISLKAEPPSVLTGLSAFGDAVHAV